VTRSHVVMQCQTRRGTEATRGAFATVGPCAGGAVPSPVRHRAPTYACCCPPRAASSPGGGGGGVVGPEEAIVGGAGSYRPSPCPCRPSAARRPRRGSPASEASLTCAASSPPIVCRPLTPIGRSRLQPCSSSHLCSQWRLRVTRWNLSLSKAYDARAKR
jgi:hypothetical protein